MSSGDAAKLETFLIVAYKTLRAHQKSAVKPLSPAKVRSMIKAFKISERDPLSSTNEWAIESQTCLVTYGKDNTLALLGLESGNIILPDQPPPIQCAGSFYASCDTAFIWQANMLIRIGEEGFYISNLSTGEPLFCEVNADLRKVTSYPGHDVYSSYGRGAKVANDCLIMVNDKKAVIVVPLTQFQRKGSNDLFARKPLMLARFQDEYAIKEVDILGYFDQVRHKPTEVDEIAWISSEGHLTIMRVNFRAFHRYATQENNSQIGSLEFMTIPHTYLLNSVSVYEKYHGQRSNGTSTEISDDVSSAQKGSTTTFLRLTKTAFSIVSSSKLEPERSNIVVLVEFRPTSKTVAYRDTFRIRSTKEDLGLSSAHVMQTIPKTAGQFFLIADCYLFFHIFAVSRWSLHLVLINHLFDTNQYLNNARISESGDLLLAGSHFFYRYKLSFK